MRSRGFKAPVKGKPYGFTLAELLIALVILGVIATFTIPKILQNQADSRRKAVLQETIATLSQLTAAHARDGVAFANTTELKDYFRQNMNYVKICSSDPNGEGCWNGDAGGTAANADGYLLHNGAFITSINGGTGTQREAIAIDWNGLAGPNTNGQDVIGVTLCLGPSDCSANIAGTGPKGPGVVGPSAGNDVMWAEIFTP